MIFHFFPSAPEQNESESHTFAVQDVASDEIPFEARSQHKSGLAPFHLYQTDVAAFPKKKVFTSRSRRIFDINLPFLSFLRGEVLDFGLDSILPLPFERGRPPSRWQKSKKSPPLSPPTNTSHPSYSSPSLLHRGAAAALQIGFPSFSSLCDPLLLLLFPFSLPPCLTHLLFPSP